MNIGVTLRALQDKGILQVLAEPNLTTVSGRAAKFLAGGEFPYPVIQGSNGGFTSVTIQFRPYGVQLEFTPYVHPDGSIRLRVNPEVSALDYTNAVKISGYTIPAISTRKADTEIELKDGQSFAISGLLDNRITDSLSKIPGIGDIPILGQLFRSKNLNHSVTELIVIVTPTVVDPLNTPASKPPAMPTWPVPFLSPPEFDLGLPSHDKVMGHKLDCRWEAVKELGVAPETQIPEGEGLCLMTVGLDADAAEQVRQAALQAQVGAVTASPNYSETLLNGQVGRLLKGAEALVCLIDFDKNKDLAVQTAAGLQSFGQPASHADCSVSRGKPGADPACHAGGLHRVSHQTPAGRAAGGVVAKAEGTLAVDGATLGAAQRAGCWPFWECAGARERPRWPSISGVSWRSGTHRRR